MLLWSKVAWVGFGRGGEGGERGGGGLSAPDGADLYYFVVVDLFWQPPTPFLLSSGAIERTDAFRLYGTVHGMKHVPALPIG